MNHAKALRPVPIRASDPWRYGEPYLSDVMNDPLVHLVMKRDGLGLQDVWPVLLRARVEAVCRDASKAA
jgi:hypothetical protein